MTARTLAAALILGAAVDCHAQPLLAPSPFAPNATLSYETEYGGVVVAAFPISAYSYALTLPARPATSTAPMTAGFVYPGEGGSNCEPEPYTVVDCAFLGGCPISFEPVWDLTSVKRVFIALQVEAFGDMEWEGSADGSVAESLRHLRDSFQTIRMVYMRDFAIDLVIQHVHYVEQSLTPNDGDWGPTHVRTSQLFPVLGHAGNFTIVLRLHRPSGGSFRKGSICTVQPGSYAVGRAGYDFRLEKIAGMTKRNHVLHTIAHELGHALGLDHSQCMEWPDGSPLEATPGAGCYEAGPTICPDWDDLTVMSYGWLCWTPAGGGYPYPFMRFGPVLSQEFRRGMLAMIANGCTQFHDTGMVRPYPWLSSEYDTDHDEIPDPMDNRISAAPRSVAEVLTDPNNEHVDTDLDGVGDQTTSGCGRIGPGDGGGAWLALVALLGIAWRRR